MLRIYHENNTSNKSILCCFNEQVLCLNDASFLHKTDTISYTDLRKLPNFPQDYFRTQFQQEEYEDLCIKKIKPIAFVVVCESLSPYL